MQSIYSLVYPTPGFLNYMIRLSDVKKKKKEKGTDKACWECESVNHCVVASHTLHEGKNTTHR